MRTRILTLVLIAGLAATAAVSVAQDKGGVDAETAKAAQVQKKVPLKVPDAERKRQNPVEPSEKSIREGSDLYMSQCSMCHGAAGRGDGDLAKALSMSMPDFTDSQLQAKRTDGEWFYVITKGHGRMPADGERLEPEWRWNMVNAIRQMD